MGDTNGAHATHAKKPEDSDPTRASTGDAAEPKTREESIAAFEKLGVCKDLAESAVGLGWKSPSNIQVRSSLLPCRSTDALAAGRPQLDPYPAD